MKEANILIQQYADWLKNNITPRQINENTIALDSPFLDRHNDYIQIYIVQGLDKMRLSDDGATLEDLRMDGFEINSKWRKSQIESVLRGFGIAMDVQTGELYTEASAHNFAAKKHALIQTILAVNDMHVLSRPNVRSFFQEDVAEYLTEQDIRYSRDLSVVGRSGLVHKYDFIISSTRVAPERFLRPINTLDKNQAQSICFAWNETLDQKPDSKLYVITNDSEGRSVSKRNVDALEEYGIIHRPYSQLDSVRDDLVA